MAKSRTRKETGETVRQENQSKCFKVREKWKDDQQDLDERKLKLIDD